MKKSFFLICILFLFSCSSENKYDENGFKHGKWTEYLTLTDPNSTKGLCLFDYSFGKEVISTDSIKNYLFLYKREVFYEHGYPKGIVKDYGYYEKKQNSVNEFYLVSGPYGKNSPRPIDIYTGLFKFIIEGRLTEWHFFDEQGKEDLYKKIANGFKDVDIQNDPRLGSIAYYKDSLINDDFALFEKYMNNKELLMKNIVSAKKIISNKNIWKKTKDDCPGNEQWDMYQVLTLDLKNKNFINNAINQSNYIIQKKEVPMCKWCGKPNYRYGINAESDYCSDKCWHELRASKGIY